MSGPRDATRDAVIERALAALDLPEKVRLLSGQDDAAAEPAVLRVIGVGDMERVARRHHTPQDVVLRAVPGQ